jgi:signal transduction histidine kinase
MRFSIRAKQVASVTALVGVVVVVLSAMHVTRLARVGLHESEARGELLANAIFHRVRQIVAVSADPYRDIKADPGLQALLQSSIYGESVTDAAILDAQGTIVADLDSTRVGLHLGPREDLSALTKASAWEQLRVIYSEDGGTLEVRQPMTLDDQDFGSIRIGVSTVLLRQELTAAVRPALITAAIALFIAVLLAGFLAQLVLRPIHVIRSGLTRLGKGELGVTLDLPPGDEFGELGTFFNTVSQQLSDRGEPKENAVALSRKLVALGRLTAGIAHEVKNPLNAMMIHLELLRTKIRKGALAASREPATVAAGSLGLTESKPGAAESAALEHVQIIEGEVRRLDEVVQGFLKFTRPEDLRLQPVPLSSLFDEIVPLVQAEAERHGVTIVTECPPSVPPVNADASMLRQALLNLAINACQAMPGGGSLRLTAAPSAKGRVEVLVSDTGVGIAPEHLSRIFDLYFTTKDHGTGIGLSMVYRIVQMHDGEIEVESTPGRGTTFRVLLPRAI